MKKGLQQRILDFIRNKKTAQLDELVEHIETIMESQDESPTKTKPRYLINRTLKTMDESGMIETLESSHSTFARLSPKGRQKLRSLELGDSSLPLPTHWDGKWRMVILDLPEEKKSERNALRYILKKAQFVKLKNSIWISPFPFEHMLQNMKADLELSHELLIIVTDQLDETTSEFFYMRYTGANNEL